MQKILPVMYATGIPLPQRGIDNAKSVFAGASGNTALWTPGAGKKFRLLGYCLGVTGNATLAAAGTTDLQLRDGAATVIISHRIFISNVGANTLGGFFLPYIDLGPYGIVSAAANNVLNLNISTALTAGSIIALAFGTEE